MNKKFPKGTTVYTGEPFVYILKRLFLNTHCDYCLKRANIRKCSACSFLGYCDSKCQKEGWIVHKQECKILKNVSVVIDDETRLFIRIINKLKSEHEKEKFFSLEPNAELFTCEESRLKLTYLYSDLLLHMGANNTPDIIQILEICRRLHFRTFTITDIYLRHIGHAVHLLPKGIKHSCVPNTIYIHHKTKAIFTLMTKVSKVDFDRLTICYVDIIQDSETKKKHLKYMFYTECNCRRCTEPERFAKCPYKKCGKSCSIEEDICSHCNKVLPDNFKRRYRDAIKFALDNFNNPENETNVLKWMLSIKRLDSVVVPYHYLRVKIVQKLYTFAENKKHHANAISYLKSIINSYRYYYGEMNFVMAGLFYRLAKLQFICSEKESYYQTMNFIKQVIYHLFDEEGKVFSRELVGILYNEKK